MENLNLIKIEYLQSYTQNWQQILDYAENISWEHITKTCGLSQEEITAVFHKVNPTHIIHTAALTNVDYCELNPEMCYALNVKATALLINEATKINAHFQLLSTDFIFDGENGPYTETDVPNPLSHYATSKWQAEQLLNKATNKNWSIVRTIIVYGQGQQLSRSNLIIWARDAL